MYIIITDTLYEIYIKYSHAHCCILALACIVSTTIHYRTVFMMFIAGGVFGASCPLSSQSLLDEGGHLSKMGRKERRAENAQTTLNYM